MTPAEHLTSLRGFMAEQGEDIFIRRYSGVSPRTHVDTPARARTVNFAPFAIVGSVVQGDRKMIVLVDGLSGILPVLTSDKAIVRGKELAIVGVDDNTRRIQGVLIGLELQVRG
jgi:hypothetical protein